ncbi:hypothetical protein DOZ44_25180 [Escherichia coli]|uniref:Uncharacterized protein n=1 Tax=Escherichia coli TaxID=562 RepID=A0A2H3MEI6_ECOLX|nr:hypothetical protein CEQ27_00110 [Escherichia coli O104:H4]AZZ29868.1 hypothetical protein CY655_28445 [Escherichia coli]EAA0638821.1 hypothetical protein [Escherichia coli]EAA1351095.1 hypothetical protein [Escherichia coli]EAA1837482.1 hypothetical protein [Escherichia coli]
MDSNLICLVNVLVRIYRCGGGNNPFEVACCAVLIIKYPGDRHPPYFPFIKALHTYWDTAVISILYSRQFYTLGRVHIICVPTATTRKGIQADTQDARKDNKLNFFHMTSL